MDLLEKKRSIIRFAFGLFVVSMLIGGLVAHNQKEAKNTTQKTTNN
jgi:hypothetical protein